MEEVSKLQECKSTMEILDRLSHDQIKTLINLHKINQVYNCLKIPALYGLACLIGWAIIEYPYWLVRMPLYVMMSCIFAGIGILVHDGAHGILFKNRFLNRCVSQILAGSLGIGFTQFRYSHIFHHRDTMNENDRDRLFYLYNIPYTIINGGRALYCSTIAGLKSASRRHVIMYIFEVISVASVISSTVAFMVYHGWFMYFIHVYLIPYFLFPSILITRLLLEHYECEPDNDYTLSRTFKSNFFCRWLWSNVNYHTVHHFWPTIPWYNLKRAHDLIEPHLIKNGAHIDSGYLKVLISAIRKYGVSCPPYWSFPNKKCIVWRKRKPTLRTSKIF